MSTPLLLIGLLYFFKEHLLKRYSIPTIVFLSLTCIAVPILWYLQVQSFSNIRFVGISVFTVWKSMPGISGHLFTVPALAKLTEMIIVNYAVHFSPFLLFITNLNLRYYQLQHVGLFYHWEFITVLIGMWFIYLNHRKKAAYQFLLYWLFLAPFPAALTTGVPYANIGRVMTLILPVSIISATGLLAIFKWIHDRRRLIPRSIAYCFISLVIGGSFIFFLWDYKQTSQKFNYFWGAYYKEAIIETISKENTASKIVIASKNPQLYMYLLFYGNKAPYWLAQQPKEKASGIGFKRIGKYEFRQVDWTIEPITTNTLYLIDAPSLPQEFSTRQITILYDQQVKIVYVQ